MFEQSHSLGALFLKGGNSVGRGFRDDGGNVTIAGGRADGLGNGEYIPL